MGKKNDQLLVIGETNDQKHFIDGKKTISYLLQVKQMIRNTLQMGKKKDQLLVIGETNDQKHFIDGK